MLLCYWSVIKTTLAKYEGLLFEIILPDSHESLSEESLASMPTVDIWDSLGHGV